MAFVPVPDTVEAALVMHFENSEMVNTLHYELSGGWDENTMTGLASELISLWATNIAPRLSNQLTLNSIRVTDMETESGQVIEITDPTPQAGAQTGDPLPANCALQVIWRTPYRGRSYRGRIFVPGLIDLTANGSSVAPTELSLFATAWGNFVTVTVLSLQAHLVVASRYHNGVPRIQGVATHVTGLSIGGHIVSQRRRLPGRGA